MKRYHLRRKDRAIADEEELKKVLKSTKYVTIAMSMDNEPYLVSLSHAYDEEANCLYFHSAKEGKKIDYMKGNNIVWGQAVLDFGYSEGECSHRYASVHFQGRVTLLESLEEKRSAITCMIRRLERNPESLIARLTDERLANAAIGRIDIGHMEGKKSEGVAV